MRAQPRKEGSKPIKLVRSFRLAERVPIRFGRARVRAHPQSWIGMDLHYYLIGANGLEKLVKRVDLAAFTIHLEQ